ncbi:MAG TPA: hypothetical protein VND23_01200 [Acidimicrobiales bacterium]|nr:hypothetical protein [Acidimicrobiales bacterium]
MARADLLANPVPRRIVQGFLGDRALTATESAGELGDVPAGSICGNVALLTKVGVLRIVATRRVRGAVERTDALRLAAAQLHRADIETVATEEHRHAFMAFVAGLLADLDRYRATGTSNPARPGTAPAPARQDAGPPDGEVRAPPMPLMLWRGRYRAHRSTSPVGWPDGSTAALRGATRRGRP